MKAVIDKEEEKTAETHVSQVEGYLVISVICLQSGLLLA